jgi:hypothetical protein
VAEVRAEPLAGRVALRRAHAQGVPAAEVDLALDRSVLVQRGSEQRFARTDVFEAPVRPVPVDDGDEHRARRTGRHAEQAPGLLRLSAKLENVGDAFGSHR